MITENNKVYKALHTAEEFTALVDMYIQDGGVFGFDIETGFSGEPSLDGIALKTKHPLWILVGFSLSIDSESAVYVPIAHDDHASNIDNQKQVAKDLWRLLQTGNAIAHNASFELKGAGRWFQEKLHDDPDYGEAVMRDYGIFPVHGDSMLLGFVMDIFYGEKIPHKETGNLVNVGKDLKSVIFHRFKHRMIEFKDLFLELKLKKQSHARFNMLPLSQKVITYACEDALWCRKLFLDIRKEADEDQESGKYNDSAYQIELLLLPVIARMDQVGLPLDWEYLKKKLAEAEDLRVEMNEEIQNEIAEALGTSEIVNVNLASPKQVADVLYEQLKIPRPKERGKESNSTAEKALQSISKEHPIVRKILVYRTVVKMIGSYLKKYLTDLDYRGDGGRTLAIMRRVLSQEDSL